MNDGVRRRALGRISPAPNARQLGQPPMRACPARYACHWSTRLQPDEPLAATQLGQSTENTGWHLTTYDDAENGFLAIAMRQ
jgi:hypothetical protein